LRPLELDNIILERLFCSVEEDASSVEEVLALFQVLVCILCVFIDVL
jgi:hypothetical protein